MRLDLSVLNHEQRDAVTAGDGPLLVLAGAGTGKTRVITYRIAHLMRSGTPGSRILGITFTNRAAREMRERLERMYPDLEDPPVLSTFHALGYRILRAEHRALEYRERFPIYDEADARAVLSEVLREIAGLSGVENSLDAVTRTISRWKNRFWSPEEVIDAADDDLAELHARVYARYRDRLNSLNAVDFDDLIYRPVRLFEEVAEVRERWTKAFDHVLVDEYQDTNTAQYHFARLLAGARENLCVVGDDDQSIYAFRGAEVEKILSFRRDFPRARVVTLEKNYRSVGTILEAANAVIGHNPHRHEKRLSSVRGAGETIPFLSLGDEIEEAEEVVGRIVEARRRGLPYPDQAILLRAANQAAPFEEKLRFHQIPYTIIGGRSFFDRREVRDVLAYLRVVIDPSDDISWLRILNAPRRGWGEGHRQRLDAWARTRAVTLHEALRDLSDLKGISNEARRGAESLCGALERCRATFAQGAASAARRLLDDIAYDGWLNEVSRNDPLEKKVRARAVAALIESLERHEQNHGRGELARFLQHLSLRDFPESNEGEREQLTLLTFHGAKGLEFRCVYLVGIEEGLIPHRRALEEDLDRGLEEERRLFYVAVTRARDRLIFTRARTRRLFGREVETLESRFINEIPEHLLERRDVDPDAAEPADAATSAEYLKALKARFQS